MERRKTHPNSKDMRWDGGKDLDLTDRTIPGINFDLE